ncbi:putative vacuolar sorting protein [Pseudovirgaria hyperparasitica]|uniref:Putative vacuolar sorting protein n=1 Tax=Pseudovirgaria hyperparasitica TaxID=470096 RepID=A0A6A6VUR3_9PEZI|nr:putative vacuolar sorting protein [Pseudovirgaria hyperparasitica]KAF2754302.1 putative vacuolar sorting protein [Pseudovirgaria hyperparasitica]
MAPHAAIGSSDIAEKARRSLLQLLEGVRGKKNLVLEKALAGPINLLVKVSTLQEYGVEKIFFLENHNLNSSQRNVVFLARGENSKIVLEIAAQIKKLRQESQTDHEFFIFWIPRRTLVSDQLLEAEGVLGETSIFEYPLHFMPLADDVLSLELEDAFGDLYLRKDPKSVFLSAKALMLLQQQHGLFPRITGKGDNAKRLADLLLRMRQELSAGEDNADVGNSFLGLTPSSSIESLIIIDRESDFATPLMTQLTYEGLLDEVFTIQSNQTEIDTSIIGPAPGSQQQQGSQSAAAPQGLKRKIQLDQKDPLYSTLVDANFATVGPILNTVARRLQASYDSKQIANKGISELKDFVAKLPGFQSEQGSLKLHTSLAEEVKKYTMAEQFSRSLEVQQNIAAGADPSSQHETIEELIARALPLPTVLRLLCLESVMSAGIKAKELDAFKRDIIHAYGPQHILTLSALEKIGLLTVRGGPLGGGASAKPGSTTNFNTARKHLKLIVDEVNESTPEDVAYVYSGYAPLSVRLVQCILQKSVVAGLAEKRGVSASTLGLSTGWKPFEDAVKQVRGVAFDEVQRGEEKAVRARQILNGSAGAEGKTVVVFYLGGICRAEIAALRFVGKKLREEGKGRRLVICTTGIVSGDGIIKSAVEEGKFEVK